MHVDYKSEMENNELQSANAEISKCKNCTLECTLDEMTILKTLVEKPTVTQKELAVKLQKSERTIKNKMDKLKEKGYIMRVNGKRNGTWKVMVDIID